MLFVLLIIEMLIPQTAVQAINYSEEHWRGEVCPISHEPVDRMNHPVVNLDTVGADAAKIL